jgi:hypothetical protein
MREWSDSFGDLPILDEIARELFAPATAAARPAGRRRRRLTGRVLVIAVLSLLALAAAAWAAATLLGRGDPVQYGRGGPPLPTVRYGVPSPDAAQAPLLTAPDPRGGLPWGLRVYTTSRGYACAQLGRVYQGRLGLLGIDGAFGGDGLFHELRPGVVSLGASCGLVDGAGHGFFALHVPALPASGDALGCNIWAPAGRRPPCPVDDVREVDYGLAGPRATSLRWRAGTASGTVRTHGAHGAYLIVLHAHRDPHPDPRMGGLVYDPTLGVSRTPAAPRITRITYRDGTSCRPKMTRDRRGSCPSIGEVPVADAAVTQASARTRVTVSTDPWKKGGVLFEARFRARVPVTSARNGYNMMVRAPRSARPPCSSAMSKELDRNVTAGEDIDLHIAWGGRVCPGRYRVTIAYRSASPHASPIGAMNLRYPGVLVGEGSVLVR